MTETKSNLRALDSPLFGYFKAMYLSFYSQRLYRDVGNRWRGFGITYLLLIIALLIIPLTFRFMMNFNYFFNQELIEPIKKLPPLVIQKGQVQFDKPMPFMVKNREGKVISIIDTTGKIKKITEQYPDLSILITKDKIHYRAIQPQYFIQTASPMPTKIAAQSLPKETNEVFDGKDWLKTAGILKLKYFAMLLMYPLFLSFFFTFYLITLLIFAFLGQLLARMFFDVKLKFSEACRLFSVSATPQIVLFFILFTFNAMFQAMGFLFVCLQAIYFFYGVIAVKRSRMALVHR